MCRFRPYGETLTNLRGLERPLGPEAVLVCPGRPQGTPGVGAPPEAVLPHVVVELSKGIDPASEKDEFYPVCSIGKVWRFKPVRRVGDYAPVKAVNLDF